jgi:hypothetical protein
MTVLAISLGAPFWFDLLNRFMIVRGGGKAPEENRPFPAKSSPRSDPASLPATPGVSTLCVPSRTSRSDAVAPRA